MSFVGGVRVFRNIVCMTVIGGIDHDLGICGGGRAIILVIAFVNVIIGRVVRVIRVIIVIHNIRAARVIIALIMSKPRTRIWVSCLGLGRTSVPPAQLDEAVLAMLLPGFLGPEMS